MNPLNHTRLAVVTGVGREQGIGFEVCWQLAVRQITVFLTGPLSGPHEVQLRGRLPVTQGHDMPLPCVQIDDARTQSSIILLFRRPSVLLTLSRISGLVA